MQTDPPSLHPPAPSSDKESKAQSRVITSLPSVKSPPSREEERGFSKKQRGERRVLGRGLDSLFGSTSGSEAYDFKKSPSPPSRALLLGIEQLVPGSHQPRKVFDRESLKALADSIKQNGLIQPIIVKKSEGDKYEIVAGERRWRAAALAGLHEVSVWVLREKAHPAVVALVENIQRENLNPIEQARAYHRLLKEHQWTQAQLSEALALPRPSLANYLRLLNLHPEVQTMVMQKKLSMAVAKLLLQEADPLSQLKWARVFASQNLSVRSAAQKLSQQKTAQSLKRREQSFQAPWQQSLHKIQDLYKTPASLQFKNKGGKLSLSFYSREQLEHLLDQLLRPVPPSQKG